VISRPPTWALILGLIESRCSVGKAPHSQAHGRVPTFHRGIRRLVFRGTRHRKGQLDIMCIIGGRSMSTKAPITYSSRQIVPDGDARSSLGGLGSGPP
jgi:hypothetical protein